MARDADETPKAIRLNILGSLEIVRDDKPVSPPEPAAAKHLLALFAVKARYEDRELLYVLWPDTYLDPARDDMIGSLRTSLNTAFSQARSALGTPASTGVLYRTQGIAHRVWESDVTVTTDLEDFRLLLGSETSDDWRVALALVRGRIAEHVPTRNMQSDWIEDERRQQDEDIETLIKRLDHDADEDTIKQRARDLLDGRWSPTAVNPEPALQETPHQAAGAKADVPSAPPPQSFTPSDQESAAFQRRNWRRKRYAAAALAVAIVALTSAIVLSSSSGGSSLPPEGSVVNAETGTVALHVTPEPLRGTVDPLDGGPTLAARNVRTESRYGKPAPNGQHPLVRANVGDVIEFSLMLHNGGSIPIPYLKLTATWEPVRTQSPSNELTVGMSIRWPVPREEQRQDYGGLPSASQQILPSVDPIHLRLPRAGIYKLDYVHGSGRLFAGNGRMLGRLPDGITQHGIALQDVGQPASCFWCANEYVRYVNFEASVTRDT
jgi:hypothetical protein